MKRISKLVTICGLLLAASAGAEALSAKDEAIIEVGRQCFAIAIDAQKFSQMKAQIPTPSDDEAIKAAGGLVTYDQQKYDFAKAHVPTPSDLDALDYAATYRYSDNSRFCVELRSKVRAAWFK